MPNIKSQKKRVITNERNRLRNVATKSRIKTLLKKTDQALESKDPEAIKLAINSTLSEIDRAAHKGVFHKRTAARKKSHLQAMAEEAIKN